MKKLISFTLFLTLVLVVMLAKTSQAQVTVVKVKSGRIPIRHSVNYYWKWSPRFQCYVRVKGHCAHLGTRRSIRVRAIG